MPVLPNMGLDIPELGGDSGEWDDKLNAALEQIDDHDHTAGAGTAIPSDGIDIDEDLPFGGHGATAMGRIAFSQIVAPSDAICLFVNTSDNELYWRTFSGTNVKLTSGTTINTSLIGGIAGDYSTVGAEVAYDDAADRYTFKQQGAPKTWARLASGDVRLYETGTNETVFVGLKTPAGLAASYDITLPLAVPASTSLMLMSAAGDVTTTNTIPNAITFSTSLQTPTIAGTPNFTGAVTMASTLGVTGLITATAGLTAAANQHVAISGTANYRHGEKVTVMEVRSFSGVARAGTLGNTAGQPGADIDNTSLCFWSIPGAQSHWRIKGIQAHLSTAVASPFHLRYAWYNASANVWTDPAGGTSAALSGTSPSFTFATPQTVGDHMTNTDWLMIGLDARLLGVGAFRIMGFTVTYDVVA